MALNLSALTGNLKKTNDDFDYDEWKKEYFGEDDKQESNAAPAASQQAATQPATAQSNAADDSGNGEVEEEKSNILFDALDWLKSSKEERYAQRQAKAEERKAQKEAEEQYYQDTYGMSSTEVKVLTGAQKFGEGVAKTVIGMLLGGYAVGQIQEEKRAEQEAEAEAAGNAEVNSAIETNDSAQLAAAEMKQNGEWSGTRMTETEAAQYEYDVQKELQAAKDNYYLFVYSASATDEQKAEAKQRYEAAQAASERWNAAKPYVISSSLYENEYNYVNDIGDARQTQDDKTNLLLNGTHDEDATLLNQGTTKDWRKYTFMTDEEKAEYNRLYQEEGQYVAAAYLDSLDDELNKRYAADIASDLDETTGAQRIFTRLLYHFANAPGEVANLWIDEAQDPSVREYVESEIINHNPTNKKGTGASFEKILGDAAASIGDMIPAMALSGLTGVEALGSGLMGLQSAGRAKQEALRDGYSNEQALTYGVMVGATETLLGELLGGVAGRAGLSSKALKPKIATMTRAVERVAATWGVSMLSEITEEELQNFLEPWYRALIFDEKYESPTWRDAWETALTTAISTFITAGGEALSMGNSEVAAKVAADAIDTRSQVDKAAERGRQIREQNDAQIEQQVEQAMREQNNEMLEQQTQTAPTKQNTAVDALLGTQEQVQEEQAPAQAEPQGKYTEERGYSPDNTPSQNIDAAIANGDIDGNKVSKAFSDAVEAYFKSQNLTKQQEHNLRSELEYYINEYGNAYAEAFTGQGGNLDAALGNGAKQFIAEQFRQNCEALGIYDQMQEVCNLGNSNSGSSSYGSYGSTYGSTYGEITTPQETAQPSTPTNAEFNNATATESAEQAPTQQVTPSNAKNAQNATEAILNERVEQMLNGTEQQVQPEATVETPQAETQTETAPQTTPEATPTGAENLLVPDAAEVTPEVPTAVPENVASAEPQAAPEAMPTEAAPQVASEAPTAVAPETTQETEAPVAPPTNENPTNAAGFSSQFSRLQEGTAGSNFWDINPNAEQMSLEAGQSPLEVPQSNNPNGQKTSKTVSSFANAVMTPDAMREAISKRLGAGDFAREVMSNSDKVREAQGQIRDKGFNDVATGWLAESNPKASELPSYLTTGIALYNEAVRKGDYSSAMEILSKCQEVATSTGQALQVLSIINKLSPDGQMLFLTRKVEKLNEQINSRKGSTSQIGTAVMSAMEKSRQDALNLISEIADAFQPKNPTAKPTDWRGEMANHLADKLGAKLTVKGNTVQPVSTILSNELVTLAGQYLPQAQKTQPTARRTAVDTLVDYYNNRAAFDEAWTRAKDTASKRYGNNAAVQTFLNSQFDAANNNTVRDAIIEQVCKEDTAMPDNQFGVRATYDTAAMAENIYNSLVAAVGNEIASDRDGVMSAINNYLEQVRSENGVSDIIDRDTKTLLKGLGVDLADVIRQNKGKKENLTRSISQILTAKYGIEGAEAQTLANDIAENFEQTVKEKTETELERTFKDYGKSYQKKAKKTWETMLTELGNLGAFESDAYNRKAAQKVTGVADITIDGTLVDQFCNATDEETREAARDAILQDIANQVPSTIKERYDAWRMIAMLGNPRTIIRNNVGNLGMFTLWANKQFTATVMETALNKFVTNNGKRTKAFLNLATDGSLIKAAGQDYKTVEDMIGTGRISETQSISSEINDRRQIFKTKFMEGVRNIVNKAQSDVPFQITEYSLSLASYLKANGVSTEAFTLATAGDFSQMTEQELTDARAYAALEAAKATFHDVNTFSAWVTSLNNLKGKDDVLSKITGMVVEGVIPFKKTPANILVRAVDYSPLGLLGNLTRAGEIDGKNYTAAQWLDDISEGLTGTAVMGLGAFLTAAGYISVGASGDDKKDEYNEDTNQHQSYALIIGDKYISLDWLAPASIPFFIGAEIYNAMDNGESGLEGTLDACKRIADPMLEMSMMSGLADALDNSSNRGLAGYVASLAFGYIEQAFPTLFGQFERTFEEDTKQMTYIDREAGYNSAQYELAYLLNRVPGLDYRQVDYVDVWGREVSTGNMLERAVNNFFSPATVTDDRSKSYDDELQEMYDHGYTSVIPAEFNTDTDAKITWYDDDGERHEEYMTERQYTEYREICGQKRAELLDEFWEMDGWEDMDEATKAEYIEKAYDYARDYAKAEISMKYEPSKWVSNYDQYSKYMTEAEYVAMVSAYGTDAVSSHYTDLRKEGVSNDAVDLIMQAMADASANRAGEYTTDVERYEALADADLTDDERIAAVGEYGNESAQARFEAAKENGYTFAEWTAVERSIADSGASRNAAEAEAIGKTKGLDDDEKLTALGLYNGTDSGIYKQYSVAMDAGFSYVEWTKISIGYDDYLVANGKSSSQIALKAYLQKAYPNSLARQEQVYEIYREANGWAKDYSKVG